MNGQTACELTLYDRGAYRQPDIPRIPWLTAWVRPRPDAIGPSSVSA